MIIREIQEKDAEEFLYFLKQLDTETTYMMYEPGERKSSTKEMQMRLNNVKTTGSIMFVAEDDKKIVGFISAGRSLANRIKHSAYIVVGILRVYRGQGLGEALFKEMEKWARDNNLVRLELTVMTPNERAIHLYKKIGFQIEGLKEKSMLVDGEYVDEYYMGKILN